MAREVLTVLVFPISDSKFRAVVKGWPETYGVVEDFSGACPQSALGSLVFYLSTIGSDPLMNDAIDVTLLDSEPDLSCSAREAESG